MASNYAAEKTDLPTWLAQVEQLKHAPEWPPEELPIEMIQTHISVLLLGRTRVVKLKKPVNFGFLDFTTLDKRMKACEDEIRLNRRLCADTYIGLGGVVETDGKIAFSGRHGKLIDHCVWMNRLPTERMLDQLVARNEATEMMIDRIAARLAEFHHNAVRGRDIARWGSRDEIRHNWEENFAQAEPFIGRTISAADHEAIKAWVNDWITTHTELFERRQREGRIVDGHGDVRCESICVLDHDICIYDCIEFNERFRCDDVASEAAFLDMDLAARGRPDLGYYFVEAYQRRRGDPDFFTLLPFYRCYRAYVRGKVLSFQLNETEFTEAEHEAAAARAKHYFDWARRYAAPLKQRALIVVRGLSGAGKTSVARAVADELGLRVISSDEVRGELFKDEKGPCDYGAGAYSDEASRLTYQTIFEQARELLTSGQSVILDATFQRAEERQQARALAVEFGATFRLIECELAPELVRARLDARAAKHEGASDATWEVYQRQRAEAQPMLIADDKELKLDTNVALAEIGQRAADWLRAQAR